jgi:hypothetical protein
LVDKVEVVVDAAEHHVATVLHYHVKEEEEVHHDIVDNSWVVVDHDYYIQEEVLLHVGNLGVVVHNSCLTVLALLEAVDHDYYTLAHPHAANFAVVVHSDHYLSNRSETAPLLLEADHDMWRIGLMRWRRSRSSTVLRITVISWWWRRRRWTMRWWSLLILRWAAAHLPLF